MIVFVGRRIGWHSGDSVRMACVFNARPATTYMVNGCSLGYCLCVLLTYVVIFLSFPTGCLRLHLGLNCVSFLRMFY